MIKVHRGSTDQLKVIDISLANTAYTITTFTSTRASLRLFVNKHARYATWCIYIYIYIYIYIHIYLTNTLNRH